MAKTIKITVRLHKELYEKIIEDAKRENRTKSGLLAKILEELMEIGVDMEEIVKNSNWCELFRADRASNEKTHTYYPPIGVRLSEKTGFYIENMALLNNDTIQNSISDLVSIYYFEI